jgi:hypothetical protein
VRGEKDPPDRPIYCDALTPRWGEGTEFRMIRWRGFKYVRFRDAPPLFFDLAADPGEQRDLLRRGVPEEARQAHDFLQQLAQESIDFDAAEWERTVRDGSLGDEYAQKVPESTGNLYLMPRADGSPGGKLVDADDVLYHPTVIADPPQEAFADWPYPARNESS